MAMAVDSRQQGHQLAGWGNDHLRYSAQPQFTNPWVSSPAPATSMYHTSNVDSTSQAHAVRTTAMSIPPFTAALAPTTAAPLGAGISLPAGIYDSQNLLDVSQGSYGTAYTAGTSPATHTYAPTSAPQYPMDFSRSQYGYQSDASRRSSHPSVSSAPLVDPLLDAIRQRQSSLVDFDRLSSSTHSQRSSFSDAIDASRGMVAMSQDLTTPRNIYGNQNPRNSTDAYGFPSTHSAHSSISSASTYPSYYNGSVSSMCDSATDYSSASESVTDMNPRTLPRPSALVGSGLPPAPQSMMGQFSSKVSSSSQKKHKCKICDKRFTRPSSLQTHMYSHTGEKPFACEVEGCGRHFSVVSNLRRHRKVHKGERDHPSPDDS